MRSRAHLVSAADSDADGSDPPLAGGDAVTSVPITLLRPADSPRLDGVDAAHALALAKSGTALPPILVHRDSMRVIDGMHRLRAAVLSNQRSIPVQFFDDSPNEAFVAAVRANILHGLPLTRADREAAAVRIIEAFPERSDGLIAAITGIAARTVAALRQRAGADISQVTARIGRDGRVRPLSSAEGRRAASHAMAKHPDASLRQIARMTGISPTTVRDVRERMRRGEDPVPAGQRGMRVRRSPACAAGHSAAGAGQLAGRDRTSLLEILRRDPSLRFTESGRNLLRLLVKHTGVPQDAGAILGEVPPHCVFIVAEIARGCADEWLRFATQLERRLHAADGAQDNLGIDTP